MALIRMGIMVGAASGSLGSTVFSHNRYGAYVRNRSVPTKVTSPYANAQKSILGLASQRWANLTAEQRTAWVTWAQTNPMTNRLGDKQILDGHTACTRLNAVILTVGGTPIDIPPIIGAPEGLQTLTPTADMGAGTFELAFTPTPLGTNNRLQVWAAIANSPGVNYVEGLYKQILVSAPNAATDIDYEAELEARFGTLQVGQVIHLRVNVVDQVTGLVSAPYPGLVAITST
jgi:hypothetical protein